MDWISERIFTNGAHLNIYRSPQAIGKRFPVVCLHGITDNGMCWECVAEQLSDEYDVIMVDARGHGQSDKPEHGYSTTDHAADISGLIRALRLDRPALLGHSMGASIATATAALYPDLVRTILLEDPPFRKPTEESSTEKQQQALLAWREELVELKTQKEEAIVAKGKVENTRWDPVNVEWEAWARAKRQLTPNVVEFLMGLEQNWESQVRKITCPALLITADPALGAIVTSEIKEYVQQINPRFQTAYFAGAGHCIRREVFFPYVELVKRFLEVN